MAAAARSGSGPRYDASPATQVPDQLRFPVVHLKAYLEISNEVKPFAMVFQQCRKNELNVSRAVQA
jgi:hypothetical protein